MHERERERENLAGAASIIPDELADARESRRLRRIHAYLLEHFREPLTALDVARAVGVSERTLFRLCQLGLGIGPMQCCRRLRLQEARRLLRSTRLSIDEVAHQCGFATSRTLQRAFQRVFGCSPSAYQKARAVPVPLDRGPSIAETEPDDSSRGATRLAAGRGQAPPSS